VTSKVTFVPAALPTLVAAIFDPRSPPVVVHAEPLRRCFHVTSVSVHDVVT